MTRFLVWYLGTLFSVFREYREHEKTLMCLGEKGMALNVLYPATWILDVMERSIPINFNNYDILQQKSRSLYLIKLCSPLKVIFFPKFYRKVLWNWFFCSPSLGLIRTSILKASFFFYFSTVAWLPYGQLWAAVKGPASATQY